MRCGRVGNARVFTSLHVTIASAMRIRAFACVKSPQTVQSTLWKPIRHARLECHLKISSFGSEAADSGSGDTRIRRSIRAIWEDAVETCEISYFLFLHAHEFAFLCSGRVCRVAVVYPRYLGSHKCSYFFIWILTKKNASGCNHTE